MGTGFQAQDTEVAVALALRARRRRRLATAIVALFVILGAAGYGVSRLTEQGEDKTTAEEYLERAKAARAAGQLPTAAIELKSAIQKDPQDASVRLLAAQTFLDMLDGEGAEAQLTLARRYGATELETAAAVALAKLYQGKYKAVVQETVYPPNGSSPGLKASLLACRGLALFALGEQEAARGALEEGLATDPHSVDLLAASIRVAILSADIEKARRLLAEAVSEAPTDLRLATLAGDVDFAARNYAGAEQSYQKVLAAQPWNDKAREDIARAQIPLGKLKEATANLDEVLRRFPRAPNTNYLRALAALRSEDYAAALKHIQAIRAGEDFTPANLIAGVASYALHQYEAANSYLSVYVAKSPNNLEARKLLSAVQVELGDPKSAVATLSPAVDQRSTDVQLLALIGEASARSGDMIAANRFLQKAVEQQPKSSFLISALGDTESALGEKKLAVEDFEKAVALNPRDLRKRLVLFRAYLTAKDYDKARDVADEVLRRIPNSALGFDMLGALELARGDTAAGRAALLKAREIRRSDPNANRNLARLAIADGKLDEARQYYEDILAENPKIAEVYLDLAELEEGAGNFHQAEEALNRGVQHNPGSRMAAAGLARYLLRQHKDKEALDALLPLLKRYPQAPVLLEPAGRAQLALGLRDEAFESFSALARILPEAGWAHRRLAEACAAKGQLDCLVAEATLAVSLDPKDKEAKLVLANGLLTKHDFGGARIVADELKAEDPTDPAVVELDGLVAQAEGRYHQAAAAFAQALAIRDSAVDRVLLARSQIAFGEQAEASKTLDGWLSAHPDDVTVRKLLGDLYLVSDKPAEASKQYAEVLKTAPKDAVVMNNLAWSLSALNRPMEALAWARKAVAIAPDSSDNLDTLAKILTQNGMAGDAVNEINKASQRAPQKPEIKLHLAQALAALGRNSEAVDVLRGLMVTNPTFQEIGQAQKLLDQLGG